MQNTLFGGVISAIEEEYMMKKSLGIVLVLALWALPSTGVSAADGEANKPTTMIKGVVIADLRGKDAVFYPFAGEYMKAWSAECQKVIPLLKALSLKPDGVASIPAATVDDVLPDPKSGSSSGSRPVKE